MISKQTRMHPDALFRTTEYSSVHVCIAAIDYRASARPPLPGLNGATVGCWLMCACFFFVCSSSSQLPERCPTYTFSECSESLLTSSGVHFGTNPYLQNSCFHEYFVPIPESNIRYDLFYKDIWGLSNGCCLFCFVLSTSSIPIGKQRNYRFDCR